HFESSGLGIELPTACEMPTVKRCLEFIKRDSGTSERRMRNQRLQRLVVNSSGPGTQVGDPGHVIGDTRNSYLAGKVSLNLRSRGKQTLLECVRERDQEFSADSSQRCLDQIG